MRHLKRFEKPQILVDNEEKWTKCFLDSNNNRPDSKKYRKEEILVELSRISFYKCFYSEVKFADISEADVDHYVEISEDKSKVFDWDNLYLSHPKCNNGKPSNLKLPNNECLNPFTDSDEEIETHLTFNDEYADGKTDKGCNTIKKYHLNHNIFINLRRRELKKFDTFCRQIALLEKKLDEDIIEYFKMLALPDKPFSLMFRILLKKYNIL